MAGNGQIRGLLVIPSLQGGHLLERMLPTLRVDPASVVVLDQGSTDATARICQEAGVELMQLERPHTYTQACNVGARLAQQRGYPFLCVANNDIAFRTDVIAELLAEMDRDPSLGVVAPSQVIVDPANDIDVLTPRVSWDLNAVVFAHDIIQTPLPPRMEADFCEFTCALIRMDAVRKVGFLDDAYGFYHEDADFGFRLRQAGYGAAYLPRSQIYHYTSSTFGRRRKEQAEYMLRNRARFAEKHLGFGVCFAPDGPWVGTAGRLARRLQPELRRFGLIDDSRPRLTVGHAGPLTSGYLFLLGPVAAPSAALYRQYDAVLAPSDAAVDALRALGVTSVRAQPGIDPDVFSPWDAGTGRDGMPDERTYVAVADPHDRAGLRALLQAWVQFGAQRARLIVAGQRLGRLMGRAPDSAWRTSAAEVAWHAAERVELHEAPQPLSDAELAALYRMAAFTLVAPAASAVLTMAESLACGTPVLFDPMCPGLSAMYRDVTGADAGTPIVPGGPEPGLLAALQHCETLGAADRAALGAAGRYGVLGRSTLRHTAMAVHEALALTQERAPARALWRIEHSGEPAPPTAGGAPSSFATASRMRLSASLARTVTMTGRRAEYFGRIWQQNGLPAAVRVATARFRPAGGPGDAASPPPPRPRSSRPATFGVRRVATPLLVGYIDAQLGLGQSLRGLARALEANGTEFSIYPFGIGVEGRRSVPVMPERYDTATPHDLNIIEVTPTELPRVFGHISADHFDGSYNILRTYWELAKGQAAWRHGHGLDRINEIWAPNAFCAAAFRDFFDGPVHIVPPCLEIGTLPAGTAAEGRAKFGLDPGIHYFLFSFDYYSFPERKNPLATIRAFLAAFADRRDPVGLVLKASGAAGHFPAIRREIMAEAEADGRITVIDASLSREDMLALMMSVDCYVSLHRSEGFGLGMAEAMAMGKPVIATGYSGNAEFVTERTGYPVPFILKPVRPNEYVHTEGQVWADPDVDAAASAMRAVIEHRDEAAARALAGQAFVAHRYGTANVGHIAGTRLAEIARIRTAVPGAAT